MIHTNPINFRMTQKFENVNHLVLNFYPDGYSLAVKLNEFPVFTSETILETARIPYEETSLLDYIENEELPPLLVEMIDSSPKLSQYKIWHNGCLILEVRDKIGLIDRLDRPLSTTNNITTSHLNNQIVCNNSDDFEATNNLFISNGKLNHYSYNSNSNIIYNNHRSQLAAKTTAYAQNNSNSVTTRCNNMQSDTTHLPSIDDYDDSCGFENASTTSKKNQSNESYFILLKPNNLSMLYDVINLTDSDCWSAQERLHLESKIVLHNSPTLFLEPDASKLATTTTNEQDLIFQPSNCLKHSRHKRKLPHSRLKRAHDNMEIITCTKYIKNSRGDCLKFVNGQRSKNNNGNNGSNNIANNKSKNSNNNGTDPKLSNGHAHHSPTECLPPELSLQQFLASKRAKLKNSPSGIAPKFQRFRKHLSRSKNLQR